MTPKNKFQDHWCTSRFLTKEGFYVVILSFWRYPHKAGKKLQMFICKWPWCRQGQQHQQGTVMLKWGTFQQRRIVLSVLEVTNAFSFFCVSFRNSGVSLSENNLHGQQRILEIWSAAIWAAKEVGLRSTLTMHHAQYRCSVETWRNYGSHDSGKWPKYKHNYKTVKDRSFTLSIITFGIKLGITSRG